MKRWVSDPRQGGHYEEVEESAAKTTAATIPTPKPQVRFAIRQREPEDALEAKRMYSCASCDSEAFPPFEPRPGQRVYCDTCLPQIREARDTRMTLTVLGGGYAPCEVCGEDVKVQWWAKCPECHRVNKVLFKSPTQEPNFTCNTRLRIPENDEWHYTREDEEGLEYDRNGNAIKRCGAELEWCMPNFNRPIACLGACLGLAKDPDKTPDYHMPNKPRRSQIIEALSLLYGLRIDRETVRELIQRAGRGATADLPTKARKALAELAA